MYTSNTSFTIHPSHHHYEELPEGMNFYKPVFRSLTQFCCGISISNFMCVLFVAMGRIQLNFSDVTLKWTPGGHIGFFGFWTLILIWLSISTPNFRNTLPVCMGGSLLIFNDVKFKMVAWWLYLTFLFPDFNFRLAFPNFIIMLLVSSRQKNINFGGVRFKMVAWWPDGILVVFRRLILV